MTRRPAGGRSLAVLLLLPLLASCDDLSDPPAVIVGGEKLSVRDLRVIYADLPPAERPHLRTRAQRSAFVEGVVERRLLQDYGCELAAKTPELLEPLESVRRETMIRRLRTLEGGAEAPTPEEIERAYGLLATEHLVERYLFADAGAATAALARFAAGEDLREAVRAANGVSAGPPLRVKWSPFPDAMLDAVVELEVGDVSPPFADGALYSIIELLERQEVPTPPLEELREQIARGLRGRKRAERLAEFLQRLRSGAGVRFDADAIGRIAERTRDAILSGEHDSDDPAWAVPDVGAEGSLVVAEWGDGARWTMADYRREVEGVISLRRPHLNLREEVRAVCQRGVDTELLLDEAERRGLAREWWTKRAIERRERNRLVKIAVDGIETTADVGRTAADSVASMLQAQQPELFRSEAKAHVVRFEFTNRQAAVEEAARIRAAGGAMARVAEILASESVLPGSYRIVKVLRNEVSAPGLDEAIFHSEPGELSPPLEVFAQWVLIEVLEIEPARVLTADEVLADVRQRMGGGSDREAVELWLAARKEDVGVAVDEQVLNNLAPGA